MPIHYFSNEILKLEFQYLNIDERKALATNLGIPQVTNWETLVTTLSQNGSNSLLNQFRSNDAEPNSYLGLLMDFMPTPKLGPESNEYPIATTPDCSFSARTFSEGQAFRQLDKHPEFALEVFDQFIEHLSEVETLFVNRLISLVFDSLDDKQKQLFIETLRDNLPEERKSFSGLGVAGGVLLLGNLGGFGTYMAMSSLLSVLSLGALPFGAYTAASSLLSIALGPVGWIALGAIAVQKFGSPDIHKMTLALAQVALTRSGLQASDRAKLDSVRSSVTSIIHVDVQRKRTEASRIINAPIPTDAGFFDRFEIGYSRQRQVHALEKMANEGKPFLKAVKDLLANR